MAEAAKIDTITDAKQRDMDSLLLVGQAPRA
jgi:hypothetical protein